MASLICVEVRAVITNAGRNWFANYAARGLRGLPILDSVGLDHFRIGTAGFLELPGGIHVPKEPLPTRTTIESDDDPVSFAFEKAFVPDDVKVGKISAGVFVEDSAAGHVLQMRAVVDFDESNDIGGGIHPEFFELGCYDALGTLVLYGTYPAQTKVPDIQLVELIRIFF